MFILLSKTNGLPTGSVFHNSTGTYKTNQKYQVIKTIAQFPGKAHKDDQ
jgi:hypothetical protein